MNNIKRIVKGVVFFTGLFGFALVCFAKDPLVEKLAAKPLPELETPDIKIKTFQNGLKLFYMQDVELPVTKITSYFEEVGSIYEKKPQRGLVAIFMRAWRSGGSSSIAPEKIDEILEFHSAELAVKTAPMLSSLSLKCLQKDKDKLLALYFDLLRNPSFDKTRLEIIKRNALNQIHIRNEKAVDIGAREFLQSLYGEDSPYAWKAVEHTIKPVNQDQLKRFYKDNIAPNRIRVAASSPLPFEEFVELFESHTDGWVRQRDNLPFPTDIKKLWSKSTEFIHKPGNQSAVFIGHYGERRFNPDKFKLILANEVLGGTTFASRLGDRIRTDLGLAYSINSNFGFSTDYGSFQMVTQTKSESTVQTVQEMVTILKQMVSGKSITEQELNLAKQRLINRLIFEYDVPFQIVNMELTYDYHDYPPHYLKKYQQEIRDVTLEDVNTILNQYFFADKLKIMIVGDKTRVANWKTLPGVVERPLDNE